MIHDSIGCWCVLGIGLHRIDFGRLNRLAECFTWCLLDFVS